MIQINTSFIKWHYIYNRDRTFTIMIILLLLIKIIVIYLILFILLFKSFIFQNIKCYIFIFTQFYFTSGGWSWDKLNQYLKKKHSAVLPYLIRSSTAGFITHSLLLSHSHSARASNIYLWSIFLEQASVATACGMTACANRYLWWMKMNKSL